MSNRTLYLLTWFILFAIPMLWNTQHPASASDDPQAVPEDEVLASQYYDVGSSDNTIHITNSTRSDLCAQIYVFDNHEQLQECCACLITSNGFRVLSVKNDLLSNPSHGTAPTRGVIELQSTLPNINHGCAVNQAPGVPFEAIIHPQVSAWITHNFKLGATDLATTIVEDEFEETDDDEVQEDKLETECANGFSGGFGRCTCGGA